MKKVVSCFLAVIILFSILPTGFSVLAAVKMESKNGLFTIEAEKVTINDNFSVASDPAMSGGKGVLTTTPVTESPGKDAKGNLEFSFVADKAATYSLWARTKPTTVNKSIWLSMGGGNYTAVPLKSVANELTWGKLGEVTAPQVGAEILVKIITKVEYFTFDQFLVTSDSSYTPPETGTSTSAPASSAAPAAPGESVNLETKDGFIKLEAESLPVNDAYQTVSDAAFSGSKALNSIENSDLNPAISAPAHLEFNLKADQKGSYIIWARVRVTTPNKGLALSINKEAYKSVVLGGAAGDAFWKDIGKISNMKAGGTVNVRIRNRVGGYDLDQIVITNRSDVIPDGKDGNLKERVSKLPDNLYPKPSFTPPPEHPRLYFTKKDIPKILKNAQKPQNAAAWTAHLANLQKDESGILLAPKAGAGNTDNVALGIFESYAFDYVSQGNEELGKKAIAGIKNYLSTLVLIDPNGDGYTRNAGQAIFTMSEIYDWCYPLLTEEDKKSLILSAETIIADGMEVGWPPVRQGSVVGHGCEAQILRDLNSFAIAVYDERPDIYNVVAGRFFAEYVPSKKYTYQAQMFNQGTHYGTYRGQWDFIATWIFDRMGLPKVYGNDQQYMPYWFLYLRRPDGVLFCDGDGTNNGAVIGDYDTVPVRVMTLAGNYYNNPYLKKEAQRENQNLSVFKYGHSSGNISPVEFLVFNNTDLEGKALSELPQTKYFPSPAGQMIARTGWEDGISSPVAVAQMKVDEDWFANHDHLDAGHFQLYYKGLLAGDSGRYDSYGNEHDFIYNKNTIAHNTMLIKDPKEVVKYQQYTVNSGGQKPINEGLEPMDINTFLDPSDPHHIGKVEGREFGPNPMKPEYTYLKGDITKAYSEKVKNYDRSFMFLNLADGEHPAAMVVFDRVTAADKSFQKTWLLHGLYEPEINENQTIFRNDVNGYNGKLTVDTLLPKADNTVIEKVGGQGKEFFVEGKNYAAISTIKDGTNKESDGWRMELSPKTPSETDYFLNVLQVGDSKPDTPSLPVMQIDTEKLAGAQIADRVIVFSKQNGRTKDTVEFSITGENTFKVLVADIEAGTWQISRDGKEEGSAVVTADGGLLRFEGTAGAYKLTYANNSTSGRVDIAPIIVPHEGIEIRVDKKYLYTDVPATIRNDRTLVPMRAIFEALKANITWDEVTSTVTGVREGTTVTLTIDSNKALVNGKEVALDVPATLINDRTMVPIRFVSESLDAKVDWDPFAQCVFITSPPKLNSSSTGGTYPPQMKVPNALPVYNITQSSSDGNDIGNSLDGDLETRWAVEGVEKYSWGIYDLGSVKALDSVWLAYYNGNARVYTFSVEVSEDGVNYTRVLDKQSTSGTTNEMERYSLNGVKARYVKFLGNGNSVNMWNSITEIAFSEKK